MHRHVGCIGNEIPLGIENRAGEIESFLDVDRVAGVRKSDAHLLGNGHEQIVEDLKQYRIRRGADRMDARNLFCALEQEMIVRRYRRAPLRLHDSGRIRLLDDGRPGDDIARTQILAIKYLGYSQRIAAKYVHFGAGL